MADTQYNFYKVTLVHDEWADDSLTGWFSLSDEEVQRVREFINQQRELFIEKYPDEKVDPDSWDEWLEDAFLESGKFYVNVGRLDPAVLTGIDIEHPIMKFHH